MAFRPFEGLFVEWRRRVVYKSAFLVTRSSSGLGKSGRYLPNADRHSTCTQCGGDPMPTLKHVLVVDDQDVLQRGHGIAAALRAGRVPIGVRQISATFSQATR